MLREPLPEGEHGFALPSVSQRPARASHWATLMKNQLARDSGRCCFRAPSILPSRERGRSGTVIEIEGETRLVIAAAGIQVRKDGGLD